ncbi:radical SAM/SPASM domain-containing protein [Agrobacterium tumefaciens]|nr:hypothetical protein BV900_15075 [Agrobacterium tumefaciens]
MSEFNFDEIRIENTNRCAYKCWFCPREKHERSQGAMSVTDFEILVDKLPDNCSSIDLHGYGEPLLDDLLQFKVLLAKRKWPDARLRIISTLGVSRAAEKVAALADAGLNSIEVSFYGTDRDSYRKSHGVNAFDLARNNLAALLSMNIEGLQIKVRSLDGADEPEGVTAQPKSSSIKKGKLHNYGDGRAFNKSPIGTCSVVNGLRSRILQVTWDLDVIPCCFDYNAELKLGNLRNSNLREIFEGEIYRNFINAHISNELSSLSPCNKCEKCFLQ